MAQWQRVGPTTGEMHTGTVVVAVGLVVTVVFAVKGWIGPMIIVAVLTVMALRRRFCGVFMSDAGVRIRRLVMNQTLPWADIGGFDVEPMSKARKYAVVGPLLMRIHAIKAITKNGDTVHMPLMFQPAEGSEPAAGASGGGILSSTQAEEVLEQLRSGLAKAKNH